MDYFCKVIPNHLVYFLLCFRFKYIDTKLRALWPSRAQRTSWGSRHFSGITLYIAALVSVCSCGIGHIGGGKLHNHTTALSTSKFTKKKNVFTKSTHIVDHSPARRRRALFSAARRPAKYLASSGSVASARGTSVTWAKPSPVRQVARSRMGCTIIFLISF